MGTLGSPDPHHLPKPTPLAPFAYEYSKPDSHSCLGQTLEL